MKKTKYGKGENEGRYISKFVRGKKNKVEINRRGHGTRSQEGCTSHHNDFGCYTKSDGKPMEARE